MTTSARNASTRRGRRNRVQAVLAALILLGVIASVVLVFSDTVQMLRVGIVVALWAAIIGAMAMTKYRRESVVDHAKTRDLQTVYELQLEREISARREFEMGVEARVRREVGADAEELAALRAELAGLRAALERLFDGELPVDRVALRADVRREIDGARIGVDGLAPTPALGNGNGVELRIPLLGNGNGAARGGHARIVVDREAPSPVLGDAVQLAGPDDSPVTAEVAEVEAGPTGPGTDAPGTSAVDGARERTAPEPEASEPTVFEPAGLARTQPEQSTPVSPPSDPDVLDAETVEDEPAAELPDATPGSRRHRRNGDDAESGGLHVTGLSVAEIMANLRAESEAEPVAGSGRRRK